MYLINSLEILFNQTNVKLELVEFTSRQSQLIRLAGSSSYIGRVYLWAVLVYHELSLLTGSLSLPDLWDVWAALVEFSWVYLRAVLAGSSTSPCRTWDRPAPSVPYSSTPSWQWSYSSTKVRQVKKKFKSSLSISPLTCNVKFYKQCLC